MLHPASKPSKCIVRKGPYSLDLGFSFDWVGRTGLSLGECYSMIRGGSSGWVVRLYWGPYEGFHVILANICYNDIKHSLPISWVGHYLAEAGVNVEEELNVKVILITTANEGRLRVLGFQRDMHNKC